MIGGCHVQPEQFFNLIFGYHDRYLEYDIDTNLGAGYNPKFSADPPADEIWIVTAAHVKNITRADSMSIGAGNAVDGYVTAVAGVSTAAGGAVAWTGTIILKDGDKIRWEFGASQAGDDGDWGCMGYKMKISQ